MTNSRYKLFGVAIIIYTLITSISIAALPTQASVVGRVVAIADGDTLTVLDSNKRQHKVRLQGIDAPERRQAFGVRARQHLSDLVFNKNVEVRVDKKDRYGRSVSVVMLDGTDINLAMIQAGFAWHYKQYEREQSDAERVAYAEAEENARKAKKGLWTDAAPTPPWEYRRAGRVGATRVSPRSTAPEADPALFPPDTLSAVIGNRNSKIYHLPNCPNYNDVSL